ncbi:hypothetical protein THAOC_06123, partial [Thalassiosira oceanica]
LRGQSAVPRHDGRDTPPPRKRRARRGARRLEGLEDAGVRCVPPPGGNGRGRPREAGCRGRAEGLRGAAVLALRRGGTGGADRAEVELRAREMEEEGQARQGHQGPDRARRGRQVNQGGSGVISLPKLGYLSSNLTLKLSLTSVTSSGGSESGWETVRGAGEQDRPEGGGGGGGGGEENREEWEEALRTGPTHKKAEEDERKAPKRVSEIKAGGDMCGGGARTRTGRPGGSSERRGSPRKELALRPWTLL